MPRPRLVFIGLDAADSHLIRRWAADGELPAFASLMRDGFTASIDTPLAVLEGGIWPTFLTSSNPATHGMFSYLQLKDGTYDLEVGMYADRLPVPPFWAHLAPAGKRMAVIDVPFARPQRGLDGIQVTNWGSHDPWAWKRCSRPAGLVRDLVRRFGDHPVGMCDANGRTLEQYADLRRRLILGVEKKTALLRHCRRAGDWDLFLAVFSESHCAGHQFWHLTDPDHPGYEPHAAAELLTSIRDVYRAIDDGIAALLEDVPDETHVLVMTSHGMGPYHAGSHLLGPVLDRLLGHDVAPAGPVVNGASPGLGAREALWGARRLLPGALRQRIKAGMPDVLQRAWRWAHPVPNPWASERAFPVPTNNMTGAIRINLRGRDPSGCVAPGREYEALCEMLVGALSQLENAERGKPAVQWVRRAGEIYTGPRLDKLPDLFVEWDHSGRINSVRSPAIGTVTVPFHEERTGDHREGGLLVGRGPSFRTGEVTATLRTEDIGPTVLDLFEVVSPPAFEGRSALPSLRAGC